MESVLLGKAKKMGDPTRPRSMSTALMAEAQNVQVIRKEIEDRGAGAHVLALLTSLQRRLEELAG